MPLAADGIQINYGSAYGSSFVLTTNPWPFKDEKLKIEDGYRTSSGTMVSYKRAVKLRVEMSFQSIRSAQWTSLKTVFDSGNPYQLILGSGFKNAGTYVVRWINGFDFTERSSLQGGGYTGNIIFEEV